MYVLASPYRHVILSILSLERDAIRVCVLSTAGSFAYQNSDRMIGHETGLSGETGTIGETFEFDESYTMYAASRSN